MSWVLYDLDNSFFTSFQVRQLTLEKNAGLALNKEARKLAMRLAKDQMALKTKVKQLQAVKNVSM